MLERMTESKWSKALYALPAVALVVPTVLMLTRRMGQVIEENSDRSLLEQTNLNLTDALHKAQKYIPGMPIEVELKEEHDLPVWEVEIVPKKGGPTREIRIDACTGDVLEMKTEG